MRIVSVQVGKPAEVHGMRTAFGKQAVLGPVRVLHEHLEGDAQADRRYHGGPDMALLACGVQDLAPHLGENLTLADATEETVCIGDVWRAGTALLEVASPRRPCRKISQYWQRPELLRLVEESGRTGWYLRVLEEGALQAGDEIALVARPNPEWSILRSFRTRRRSPDAHALAQVAALSDRWKSWLI